METDMSSRPLLSICIPTYNREAFLRECLTSLKVDNLRDQIEIIVSDNASTDHTLSVLEDFRDLLPLRWIIQSQNQGADRNFDAVVAEARGEYCWLLGSDDAAVPGALQRLVDLIHKYSTDILQFGYIQADISLRPLRKAVPTTGIVSNNGKELALHLGSLPTLSLLFTFISAYVFRRSVWMDRREMVLRWVGSNYIQTAAMHAALVDGATLAAVSDCLVFARGDNPNEFNSAPGRFIALDACTMNRLMTEIYRNEPEMWTALGNTFRRSYPIRVLISSAANGGLHYLNEVCDPLEKLGYSKNLIKSLRVANWLKILSVFKLALNLRRVIRSKIRH